MSKCKQWNLTESKRPMPVFRKRISLNDFANLYIYLTVHRKFWKMLLSTTATSGDEIIHFSLFSVLHPEYCIIDPRNQTHNSIIFLSTLLTRVILSNKVLFLFSCLGHALCSLQYWEKLQFALIYMWSGNEILKIASLI